MIEGTPLPDNPYSFTWNDPGSDPIADIRRWQDGIWAHGTPNTLIMSPRAWFRISYALRRRTLGKPWTKRSWRRHRGQMRARIKP